MSLMYGIVAGDAHDLRNQVGGARAVRIDQSTRATTTISYEHHEIHASSLFSLQTYSDNLANANAINIVMTTPNTTKEIHLIMEASSSLAGLFEFFTGPTVTAASGSPATPASHNQFTPGTSTTVCRTGMTVTGDGTLLYRRRLDSGSRQGLSDRGVNEWVLARNTTYLFRISSLANSNVVNLILTFYEHTART